MRACVTTCSPGPEADLLCSGVFHHEVQPKPLSSSVNLTLRKERNWVGR